MFGTQGKDARRGIGLSLVGLVLVAVVPLLVFGGGVAWMIIDQKKNAVVSELASTTSALRVAVDRELDSQLLAMEVLATDVSLDIGDLDAFHERARRAVEVHDEWLNVALVDPRSHSIIAGAKAIPTPAPTTLSPAAADEVVRTRKSVIAGVFASGRITRKPIILFMSPVIRDNEVRYILAVTMDLNPVSDVLREQRLSASWTGEIVDNHMMLAGRSHDPERYVGVHATPMLADLIAASENGMFTALNQEGATVYTVFSRSPVTGWSVAIGVPSAEVDGPIRHMLLRLAGVGGTLIAFALFLTAMVGRGILRRRNAFEQALHESQSKLQESLIEFSDLVARIPIGVYKLRILKEGGYRFDFVSESWCKWLHVTADEVYKDPSIAFSHIHPDELPKFNRLNAVARKSLQPFVWEGRVVWPEGVFWLHLGSSATLLSNGDILWNGILYDITERKRAEDDLLKIQHNLTEAQSLAHLGSWELDLVHNRLTWSEEMYRIFGMPPEEFDVSYETFLDTLHPDDCDRVDRAFISSLNEGGQYDIEYRIIRRSDGQLRWEHARCEHERDANGKVLRSLGTVQDITERKSAESIVERERIRLQTILKTASDGIYILDTDGVLVEANEAFLNMLGYDDSIIGKLRVTDWSQASWAESSARINDLTSRHGHEVFETRQRRSDGLLLDVEINATAINLEGKNYIYAAARDITTRKQAEAELIAAKQAAETASLAKTRFLAAASHDLRQPLQAIGLFNDALARTGLNEIQERIRRHLSTSVNSLGELLNRLLDISRLDAYMIKPQPVVIQAEDILRTIDAEFASLALEKNLRFNLICPIPGLALFSDENLLMDLLRNLVSNAVKYTEQGGVLVSIRRRGDRALIQVWDTGIGIAPEHQDSIFEEYFQVTNPERERAKGVGLGLAIVRRLSELLGTEVSCRSRVSKGSVFGISLALAKGSDAHASSAPIPATLVASASARFAGKRIVVIEDDAQAAEAIKLSLEMHDIQVTLFGTAEDALGSTEALEADYYISDYRLPGMDGLQLLDAIQRASAKPIKAVLLTGDTSPDRIALAQSSRWTVLFKPVDLPRLLSALER